MNWVLYCFVFFSGVSTLIYEIVFSRKASLVFGSTIYSMSTVITAFLIGFGLGGVLYNLLSKKKWFNHHLCLCLCQLIIATASLLFLYTIGVFHHAYYIMNDWFGDNFYLFIIAKSVFLSGFLLIPTTAFGLFFVTICKLPEVKENEAVLGYMYAISNFGSVVGSWGSAFVLVPLLGLKNSVILAACMNLSIGFLLMFYFRNFSNRAKKALTASILTVLLALGFGVSSRDIKLGYASFTGKNSGDPKKAIIRNKNSKLYGESIYSSIILTENGMSLSGEPMCGRSLQANLSANLQVKLPIILAKKPSDTLIVGFGCGFAAWHARESGAKNIKIVEIDKEVPIAAKSLTFFKGDLADYHFIYDDGRNYIEFKDQNFYDVIAVNAMPIHSSYGGNFYTVSFFDAVKSRLKDGGVFSLWAKPADVVEVTSIYATLKQSFKHVYLAQSGIITLFLAGERSIGPTDLEKVRQIEVVKTEGDISILGNLDEKLFSLYDCKESMQNTTYPINTDDNLFLELHSAKYIYSRLSEKNAEKINHFLSTCNKLV